MELSASCAESWMMARPVGSLESAGSVVQTPVSAHRYQSRYPPVCS